MKKLSTVILAMLVIIALFVSMKHPDWIVGGLPTANAAASDKYDGDCPTPPDFATTGRCADKCLNQTDTLLGYDPETGAAICKPAPTGCPYGDSIPLDSGKCEPPQSISVYNANQQTETAAPEPFVGK